VQFFTEVAPVKVVLPPVGQAVQPAVLLPPL
jgi:hypothetical protein